MKICDWNIEEQTGYKPITTYYTDFSIAEAFGGKNVEKAVRDTYNRAMDEKDGYAVSDYKVLTEFVMVLNWKSWQHYQTNELLARVYDELWEKAEEYVLSHLKGEELEYYYSVTD